MQPDTINHGDPEPPHHTRWRDAAGTVHDYSTNAGRWGQPGTYYFTIWNQIPERYFPMTREADGPGNPGNIRKQAQAEILRKAAERVARDAANHSAALGIDGYWMALDSAADMLNDWADQIEGG